MPTFSYVARDGRGERVKGSVEAADAGALAERLARMGYTVTRIDERAAGRAEPPFLAWFGRRASTRELVSVYLELSTMLHAGIPLTTALGDLAEERPREPARVALADVKRRVEEGEGLSAALRAHPRMFPKLACEMVEAGETSGRLDATFQRLARHAEREEDISTQVKAAVRYPALVGVSALGVIGVSFTSTLPGFEKVFGRMSVELPPLTRFLLDAGHAVRAHGAAALGFVTVLVLAWAWLARREDVALFLDGLRLRIPAAGALARKLAIARFARTLGTLTAEGIPILRALAISERVAGNRRIARAIAAAAEEVRRGRGLAEPLGASGEFPPAVVRMIAAGEKTGRLDVMCAEVSDHYDREIPYAVKRLTTYLEFVLILFMGALVALIAFAFLMPMAEVLDLV